MGKQIEANESEDEFKNNESRIAKAKAKAKALKKRGKSVQWVTRVEFDEDLSFVGSAVDVELKTEFIKHKTSKTKVGETCIYSASMVKKWDLPAL